MRLTETNLAIRPRSQWQAIDLGTRMAQRQQGLLMASCAAVYLPLSALLTLLFWQQPIWAALLIWWLKPLCERLTLHILSTDIFAQAPSLGQSLKALPGLLKPQLLASLTWRRFSPTRSFDLAVQQLEQLQGRTRSKRIRQLHKRGTLAAVFLTLFGVHLEILLYMCLMIVFWFFIPEPIEEQLDWLKLISSESGEHLWLEHLGNWLYALVLIFWQPFYVACGFSLYLNRRTELEAWDIELSFRRLRQRLMGSAYALILALGCLTVTLPSNPAWADEPNAQSNTQTLHTPESPRLLKQQLNSETAHNDITQLLADQPFSHPETVTRWRLAQDEQPPDEDEKDAPWWLKWILDRFNQDNHLPYLSALLEIMLWALLLAGVVIFLWYRKQWLSTFAQRLGLASRSVPPAPTQLFGLTVAPQSLPDDIPGTVEQLWPQHPREALSLLYRALLSRLLHHYQLPLREAHTEAEVLAQIHSLAQPELQLFAQTLTQHWQALAYGQRRPAAEVGPELCQQWRQLFEVQP